MATRSDVDVDFIPSPRIVVVASPSTEFVAQDIVDTLRIREESFRGQTESKLVNASGKESLGGGVKVGITVELQDTQVAFEGRTTPAQTGTVTTNGQFDLFDISATFITNQIQRGSLVINFTDESIAEVRSIVSETQLKTKLLVNGISNTFSLNDNYQIFNIIQCDLTGGNVVAVDEFASEISPVLPTAFTQVIRTAASSATLQEQSSIQYSSFNGGVTVDIDEGIPGTGFPIGTGLQPSNNMLDAHTIANARGFELFFIKENITLSIIDLAEGHGGHIFKGVSPTISTITVDPGAIVTDVEILDAFITGTLDSNNIIRRCLVGTINDFNGGFSECTLTDTITLAGNAPCYVNECKSGTNGSAIFDMGGSGQALFVSNYNGKIKITNKTGIDVVNFYINSGTVEIDSTVTNGIITVGGVGKLIDNSTGGAVIVNEIINGAELSNIHRVLELQRPHHTATGNIWYWNPHAGNDTNEGDHISRAVKTFTKAHDLALDGNHDLIICVAGNPSGKTITNEICIISKNYLMVRGPGRDFEIANTTDDGQDAILITGNGVEVSGMIVSTNSTNSEWAVHAMGEFVLIKDTWISNSNNGVHFETGEYNIAESVKIHHNTGIGIKFSGTTTHSDIIDCHIGSNGGDGILVDILGGHEVNILESVIHNNGGWGINITANSNNVIIHDDVTLFGNIVGDINDLGTGTHINATNTEIFDIVVEVLKYNKNHTKIDPVAFTLTVFEDGSPEIPLKVFNLKDENGVASITSIFERIPQ